MNTNFISSRHVKRENTSLPVDVRRSKTSLLKLPILTPCYCSCRWVIMHKFGYLVSHERNSAVYRDVSAANSWSSSCDVFML